MAHALSLVVLSSGVLHMLRRSCHLLHFYVFPVSEYQKVRVSSSLIGLALVSIVYLCDQVTVDSRHPGDV